jgi:glycyl-tRNA synthetase beta chain
VKRLPFLLEIGVEEVPDWMIPTALAELAASFGKLAEDSNLAVGEIRTDATPRRLALRAEGLEVKQADSVELVSGPPKSAGAGAAAGFARKLGVEAPALETVTTPKGEYLAYRRKVKGREAAAVLSETLPSLILGIPWPKTMYWTGKGGARFIRPIRWMVALLGKKVVPFEIAGVASGNVTTGHRRLGKKKIRVSIADYEARLEENSVLVSAAERRAKIEAGIAALLGDNLRLRADPALLETLVYITECPTPILGGFDPQYLSLPEEVLVTVMRRHQKYFSVSYPDGKLAPNFIAVMNTSADPDGLVRRGNERVLRARFNDARFFWDFDQHKKLADRVQDLAHVTFQAKLGSYLDKTRRMMDLVGELGGCDNSRRAAELSKCDLTCEMVKEFTELQGIVGGLYARAQGEPEEVARAIYEHYKPVSMEDSIPATPEGRFVALADKLDTLRGCFAIGMVPTGSKDPFALRRAAQGVVKILVEGRMPLAVLNLTGGDAGLIEFFRDRVEYYFREVRGFPYDEVRAVMAAGGPDLVDVESRLAAIHAVRPTENFVRLAGGVKRIKNILRQAQFAGGFGFSEELLETGPERDLYEEFLRLPGAAAGYRPALEAIASLRPKVDLFFDKVLVNAPDPGVRGNRLTLLSNLLTEFSKIADFSEIVTETGDGPAGPRSCTN